MRAAIELQSMMSHHPFQVSLTLHQYQLIMIFVLNCHVLVNINQYLLKIGFLSFNLPLNDIPMTNIAEVFKGILCVVKRLLSTYAKYHTKCGIFVIFFCISEFRKW